MIAKNRRNTELRQRDGGQKFLAMDPQGYAVYAEDARLYSGDAAQQTAFARAMCGVDGPRSYWSVSQIVERAVRCAPAGSRWSVFLANGQYVSAYADGSGVQTGAMKEEK